MKEDEAGRNKMLQDVKDERNAHKLTNAELLFHSCTTIRTRSNQDEGERSKSTNSLSASQNEEGFYHFRELHAGFECFTCMFATPCFVSCPSSNFPFLYFSSS